MLVNSSSTSIHFNMVRNISLSVHIFIPTLKIELISWQVDLMRVDLVTVDLVRIDLVTPSRCHLGKFSLLGNVRQAP